MSDQKQYTFYFYRPEPVDEGSGLASFLDGSISQQPTAHSIVGDYFIQIQELGAVGTSMIRGVVKKFRSQDIPSLGKIGEKKERPIPLEKEEAILEKTHFLYDSSLDILLYQQNVYGTTVKSFGEYLSHLVGSQFSFNPVIVPEAYKKMLDHKLRLKKFNLKIARPTNVKMTKGPDDSIMWYESMKLLDESTASRLELTLSGDRREGIFLNENLKQKILDLLPRFGEKDGGKVTLVDGEGAEQVIDLIAERLSVKLDVTMKGKYPDIDLLFESMTQAMKEKKAELKTIFG